MTFPHLVDNPVGASGHHLDFDRTLEWLGQKQDEVKSILASEGAVLLRGFPITTAQQFDAFSAAFGYEDFTYQESFSNAVRINHTPRVFTANEAPPHIEIFLHHEMAQTPLAPTTLFFCCLRSADEGGETPVCRSDRLYAELQKEHPVLAKQFQELGLKYTTRMPRESDSSSGQGRSWRDTLNVEHRDEAEAKLATLGYSWQWQSDEALSATTPALPAVKALPDGSETFFNQVIAVYLGWQTAADNLDKALTFGNGASIPKDGLDKIVDIAKKHTVALAWQDGDVALIDNHRVMHGRYPYGGDRQRQVLVSLAR